MAPLTLILLALLPSPSMSLHAVNAARAYIPIKIPMMPVCGRRTAINAPLRSTASSVEEVALVPRAAVAVVVRWRDVSSASPRWLLVQRGKEPNKGMWSIPGGSIEPGEGTLDAAKRELWEETGLKQTKQQNADVLDLRWHADGPFTCSDSIHLPEGNSRGFHYVIAQTFAEAIAPSEPTVEAQDDAMDARWWSAEGVQKAEEHGTVSTGVWKVIERSEQLYAKGLLDCT